MTWRYPHRIDLPLQALDLGRRSAEIIEWINANVDPDGCGHGVIEEALEGTGPRQMVRFYFADLQLARRFHQVWGGRCTLDA